MDGKRGAGGFETRPNGTPAFAGITLTLAITLGLSHRGVK